MGGTRPGFPLGEAGKGFFLGLKWDARSSLSKRKQVQLLRTPIGARASMTCGATWDDVRGTSFARQRCAADHERAATRERIATDGGDERAAAMRQRSVRTPSLASPSGERRDQGRARSSMTYGSTGAPLVLDELLKDSDRLEVIAGLRLRQAGLLLHHRKATKLVRDAVNVIEHILPLTSIS